MTHDDEKVTRITRVTYPTAAFNIKKTHVDWIARGAKREGVSKSEFVRRTFDAAMKEGREDAA